MGEMALQVPQDGAHKRPLHSPMLSVWGAVLFKSQESVQADGTLWFQIASHSGFQVISFLFLSLSLPFFIDLG